MGFVLAREACVPVDDSQFCLEKWVPEEDLLAEFDEGFRASADGPWSVPPFYRLFKLDGTELMETTDWSNVVGYLQAVVSEKEIPKDFEL